MKKLIFLISILFLFASASAYAALEFDGTNDYLEVASAPVSIEPFTMATWYYSTTSGVPFEPLLALADSAHTGGDDKQIRLIINDIGGQWTISANSWSTDGYHRANATAASSHGVWQHATGVWASQSSRAAYLNGGSKGTDTNLNDNTQVPNELNIGYGPWSGGTTDKWNGYLAETAIWNVALTDEEVAILAKGFSPRFVRPQNLVFYLPGVRNIQDLRKGVTLIQGGTVSTIAHPRIIYPR